MTTFISYQDSEKPSYFKTTDSNCILTKETKVLLMLDKIHHLFIRQGLSIEFNTNEQFRKNIPTYHYDDNDGCYILLSSDKILFWIHPAWSYLLGQFKKFVKIYQYKYTDKKYITYEH